MSEERRRTTGTARTRVLPETELLNELESREELEHAETFAWRARKAGKELRKMGPVLAALGDRLDRLGKDVEEAVAFRYGRSYFEVELSRDRVLARSERRAIEIVGEQAACGWDSVETEAKRIPWTHDE